MPERGRMRKKVCKVWTVRNRPVNLTPRKRETRDLRIGAPSSKRVQREGGSSSLVLVVYLITQKKLMIGESLCVEQYLLA